MPVGKCVHLTPDQTVTLATVYAELRKGAEAKRRREQAERPADPNDERLEAA